VTSQCTHRYVSITSLPTNHRSVGVVTWLLWANNGRCSESLNLPLLSCVKLNTRFCNWLPTRVVSMLLYKAPSILATMSKQHCRTLQVERFFRQCRMLLRHCCWCGRGLKYNVVHRFLSLLQCC